MKTFSKKTKVCYVITTQLDFSLRVTATAPIKLRRYEYESFNPNSDVFCYACVLIFVMFPSNQGPPEEPFLLKCIFVLSHKKCKE